MGALSDYLGNSTTFEEFRPFDSETGERTGKVYRVRLLDQNVKTAVEKRLFARARYILRESKDDLIPEEYQAQLHTLNLDFQAGVFAFEAEGAPGPPDPKTGKPTALPNRFQQFIRTHSGILCLAALLFQCDEVEMVKLMGDHPAEVISLVQKVMESSLPKAKPPAPSANGDAEKKSAATPNRPDLPPNPELSAAVKRLW